jgi:chromosomal replication initiator protein
MLSPGGGPAETKVDMETILNGVAAFFNLKVTDLTGQSKLRHTAWPRRVAMLLAREMTGLTTTDIGAALGGRDHSTVIHALKKIQEELRNPTQVQAVENIRRSLIVSRG